MIQIEACDGCSIIECISDPHNSREHGITGVFVCRGCMKMKGWHQSMTDEPDAVEEYARAQFVPDRRHLDVLGISRMMDVVCPFGRKTKSRFAMCVTCFQERTGKMNAIARLAEELKLDKEPVSPRTRDPKKDSKVP